MRAAAPSVVPRRLRARSMIVGGHDAAPGEFPYQLSLQTNSFGQWRHFCGASIYDATTAVCAGHCVLWEEDWDDPKGLRVSLCW